MRRHVWMALVAAGLLGVTAACAGDEEEGALPEEGVEVEPAPAPAPAPQQPAGQAGVPSGPVPPGATQEMIAQGQQIFSGVGNCFTCHGPDAQGTQLAPNLTDSEWINVEGTYESIIQVVNTGVPQPVQHPAPMPPMGGAQLTEDQVRAVAAYVYAISHTN